jgi:YD repeat-containing protein
MALVQTVYPTTFDDYIYNYGNYDSSGNPTYIGMAKPGTADSAAGWKIIKLLYDGSGNVTSKHYPKKTDPWGNSVQTNEPCFVWDNRASYTYTA